MDHIVWSILFGKYEHYFMMYVELLEMNEFLEHNNGVIERHCKIVAGLEG